MATSEAIPLGHMEEVTCRGKTWRLQHRIVGVNVTAITLTHVCPDSEKCCNDIPLVYDPTPDDWDRCVAMIRDGVERFTKKRGW